jgi:two-component system response regulator MprA
MYPEGQEILVVINNAECRERIAAMLRDEGFAVTEATEGLAALRAIGAERFALIVAGTSLPGSLDGRATVRQARTRQPWLKALFIEDHHLESHARPSAGNPDHDDLIVAPFERHELIGCTFELLHRGTAATYDLARRARTALVAF